MWEGGSDRGRECGKEVEIVGVGGRECGKEVEIVGVGGRGGRTD